jgi:hypothetical protein
MQDGFFYAPANKGRFYIRSDSGNPGETEIGARPFGIRVRNQEHVTIRDIAIFGGGGQSAKKTMTNLSHVLIDNSSHIQMLNMSSRHNSMGIRVINGSRNNRISGLDAYGHRSTAVYFWEAGPGNIIEASKLSHSGNVITDTGDMGLVGVFRSPQTTVRDCRLSNNGHVGAKSLDGVISYVRSPGGQIVGNTVVSAGGTGIQVVIDSDNCVIRDNTIDGWCTHGSSFPAWKGCEGIRIGAARRGDRPSARNCTVSSNRIISQSSPGQDRAALKIMDVPTEGLIFENNEISVMPGTLVVYAKAQPRANEWTFRDNTYHVKSRQHAIYRLGEITYRAWEIDSENLGKISAVYGLENGSSLVIADVP